MRAALRDTEIFFDIHGASLVIDGPTLREKPVAFLPHGGPGVDHSVLKGVFAPLADRLQLVFFDHRGHGRSARGDPRSFTLDENVEDMEALRRYLGVGPIVSIGCSYGGQVAMAHAARYPHAVSHLILSATTAHAGNLERAREILKARGSTEQVQMFESLLAGSIDTDEKLQGFLQEMGPLYSVRFDAAAARASAGIPILSPDALNRAFGPGGCMRNCDLRPELGSIRARTLILAGRHDWICAPEFASEIHELIPGSDLRIFEHSSHALRSDEPQAFLDAIAGFLVYNT